MKKIVIFSLVFIFLVIFPENIYSQYDRDPPHVEISIPSATPPKDIDEVREIRDGFIKSFFNQTEKTWNNVVLVWMRIYDSGKTFYHNQIKIRVLGFWNKIIRQSKEKTEETKETLKEELEKEKETAEEAVKKTSKSLWQTILDKIRKE